MIDCSRSVGDPSDGVYDLILHHVRPLIHGAIPTTVGAPRMPGRARSVLDGSQRQNGGTSRYGSSGVGVAAAPYFQIAPAPSPLGS